MQENIDLIFNSKKVKESREILESIRRDLAELDQDLYDAVMLILQARGIEEVEKDSDFIDMRKPESIMRQCREEGERTINFLDAFTSVSTEFSEEKDTSSAAAGGAVGGTSLANEIQKRLANTEEGMLSNNAMPTEGKLEPINQALYGVPNPDPNPVRGGQFLYGPPEPVVTPIEPGTGYQPMYGVPNPSPVRGGQYLYGPPDPIVVSPEPVPISPEPIVSPQLLYGPPSLPTPVTTPDPTPIPTPVITPEPTPISAPVVTPEPTPIAAPVTTPDPTPISTPVVTPVESNSFPEYVSTPDTGIGIISEPTNMTPAIAAGITAAVVGTKVGKEKYKSRKR